MYRYPMKKDFSYPDCCISIVSSLFVLEAFMIFVF